MNIKNISDAVRFREDRLSKVNLFETANFFCDVYCLRPGQAQKVHSHPGNDKIYAVVRGEARVVIGAETRDLGEGDIVMAPAGEPHGIENTTQNDVVCLVFMTPHPSFGPTF